MELRATSQIQTFMLEILYCSSSVYVKKNYNEETQQKCGPIPVFSNWTIHQLQNCGERSLLCIEIRAASLFTQKVLGKWSYLFGVAGVQHMVGPLSCLCGPVLPHLIRKNLYGNLMSLRMKMPPWWSLFNKS